MTKRIVADFEACRADLVSLAYRMLGDVGRAEDMVQEAWLRWQAHQEAVDSPRAFLLTVVTRLCLNELESARVRREQSRPDRLPEPVDLEDGGMGRAEQYEQVSMAFLVLLQALKPAERAVLLLHDVFDFEHEEIAALISKSSAACRKILQRAREHVAAGRSMLVPSRDEHRRLLHAFVRAARAGDVQGLVDQLADDAILITDGGSRGRVERGLRNLRSPLQGATQIASFVAATARRPHALRLEERELKGQPAVVFWGGDHPFAAMLLAISAGRIQRVFFHADLERLAHVGQRRRPSS